ncbi:hypothetical protein B0G84_8561 [Paraburkholderia sp. BL8N3]|nr:hypothetical protein [Paraburkholderia sp. BL8N3]TCK32707.1 hypothetical protein B0G84_8561 [Paraburkholderia sp. BL8N3]
MAKTRSAALARDTGTSTGAEFYKGFALNDRVHTPSDGRAEEIYSNRLIEATDALEADDRASAARRHADVVTATSSSNALRKTHILVRGA